MIFFIHHPTDPRGRCRLGFRGVAVDQSHLPVGRSSRNRIRLEIHSKKLRFKYQSGMLLFIDIVQLNGSCLLFFDILICIIF